VVREHRWELLKYGATGELAVADARIDRLAELVVTAGRVGAAPVLLDPVLGEGDQQRTFQARHLSQLARHRGAAPPLKGEVKHRRIRLELRGQHQRFRLNPGAAHPIARLAEDRSPLLDHVPLVTHDQDPADSGLVT
jgi:hypothetical protein